MRTDHEEVPIMKAIRVHKPGGPEVLRYEEAPDPKPEAGEVLLRVEAAQRQIGRASCRERV